MLYENLNNALILFRTSSCPTPPDSCGFEYFNSESRNPHVLSGALVGGPDVNDVFKDRRRDQV